MQRRHEIQPLYTRRVDDTRHRVARAVLIGGLVILGMMMGFIIAVFGVQAVPITVAPLGLLLGLALWLAPDVDTDFDRTIIKLFVIQSFLGLIWPSYVAFDVPGLPWMGLERIVLFALLAVGMFAIATSGRLRREIREAVAFDTVFIRLFLGFVIVQLIVLPIGGTGGITPFINNQIVWTFLFLIGAWAFSKEGVPTRWNRLLVIGCAITAVLAVLEAQEQRPIYSDYIPPFLKPDAPELMAIYTGFQGRSTDGIYRARSVYSVALTYAEFIAITLAFVIHLAVTAKTALRRIAVGAIVPLMFYAGLLTNARTAMVGFIVAPFLYLLFWAWRRYLRMKAGADLVAPAVLWAYPAAGAAMAAAVLFVHRIRIRVIGGGQHEASNQAREDQWASAIRRAMENPLGYGQNQSGNVIGYKNRAGQVTVDSYYVTLLSEYGVMGLALWVSLFAAAIIFAYRTLVKAETAEEKLAIPLIAALGTMMVTRYVSSSPEILPLAFTLLALSVALQYRMLQKSAVPAAVSVAPAVRRRIPRFAPQPGLPDPVARRA